MIKVTLTDNLEPPEFNFLDDLSYIAERIFIPIMQQNIEDQVDINGNSFPELDKKTIKRKQQLGQGDKTLIASRELIESFYSLPVSHDTVMISLMLGRNAIGRYLQIDGIGKAKKKFKFFGINKQMENNAVAYMKQRISEVIKNA